LPARPSENISVAWYFATIDTSVLLSLQCVGLLGELSVLFQRILVPRAVRGEVDQGAAMNNAIDQALKAYAIFEMCDDYYQPSVKLLLDARSAAKEGRDTGEAEAVIQAAERSCMVLSDDRLGRQWARQFSLECHGTLWVIRELRRREVLREVRPLFEMLLRRQRWQPLNEMNGILAEFRETSISGDDYRRRNES
jgi:predicted nucleic acid-binding protein